MTAQDKELAQLHDSIVDDVKSLKDLLDKLSRFTNSLVYDGGICKRLF